MSFQISKLSEESKKLSKIIMEKTKRILNFLVIYLCFSITERSCNEIEVKNSLTEEKLNIESNETNTDSFAEEIKVTDVTRENFRYETFNFIDHLKELKIRRKRNAQGGNQSNSTDAGNSKMNVSEDVCIGAAEFCNMSKEEYVAMLNDYIYPQTYEWVLIGTHSLVFVMGLVGNALVCAAVYRNHSMRTVTNYFIVNLALADFMVILFCLPATVLWDVTETWFLGNALCKILLYFQVSEL